MLENTLFDLRDQAFKAIGDAPAKTSVDAYATVRFVANLRPESTEAIFSSTHHTTQAEDLRAFDAAIGETGQSAGFGTNTTLTEKHTNLLQKRKPNDSGTGLVKGVVLEMLAIKTPKTTTNAATIADDSNDTQYLAPDASGAVQDFVAKAIACDYMPYVQKTGGKKEHLGPIRWEATESGRIFAFFAFPEGWVWGGSGQGSEFVFGFERKHLTYNAEWTSDAQRPFEDIADGLAVAFTGSQPAAATVLCCADVAVRLIGAQKSGVRP